MYSKAARRAAPPGRVLLLRNFQTRIPIAGRKERQFRALIEHGFGDLNQPLLSVLVFPYPDGARPGELAERINMTKQAMNYLLGQLETLGYIERRAEKGNSRRLVFLTRRGWQAVETIRAAVKEVEAEWAAVLGQKRFDELIEMLRQLSSIGTTAPDHPTLLRRGRAADVA